MKLNQINKTKFVQKFLLISYNKRVTKDTQASKSILTNREIYGRERLTFHAKDVTRQKAEDVKIALAGKLIFI